MKTSTQIEVASSMVGEERAVALVAEAGFDAWDFSMFPMANYDWGEKRIVPKHHPLYDGDYLAFSRKLKQIGLDHGIVCNQSHAPFPSKVPGMEPYLKRAIECTAEAGGKICVIHPDNNSDPQRNAEMYFSLLPFAKACGVKIATENMWNWDDAKNEASPAACSDPSSFLAHLDAVNDPFLVACLDIGHAEMRGLHTSAVEMIHALGPDHLQALHIHDNDRWHDNHQLPFTMQIEFPPIVRALKEIGYRGDFTLEADNYLHAFDAQNLGQGLADLYAACRRLADLFEKSQDNSL